MTRGAENGSNQPLVSYFSTRSSIQTTNCPSTNHKPSARYQNPARALIPALFRLLYNTYTAVWVASGTSGHAAAHGRGSADLPGSRDRLWPIGTKATARAVTESASVWYRVRCRAGARRPCCCVTICKRCPVALTNKRSVSSQITT